MSQEDAILVLDDVAEVAATLAEFLRGRGHTVLVAHTGRDALAMLAERPVGLLLLDLELPDMHGTAVMRRARRVDHPPEIVVVTGHAALASAVEAVESGAAGYIIKPVDLARLGVIVDRIVSRRRLQRDNERLTAENAERRRDTEALLAVSSAVGAGLDLREALRRICRELTRLTGADTSAAYVAEPTADHLVALAGYRVPRELASSFLAAPLPLRGPAGLAPLWRYRRPVFTDDVGADERFGDEFFRRPRHQSGLLLPLVSDDEIAGAFYLVWWRQRHRPSERDLGLAEIVARQSALLVRTARLAEDRERARRRLDVLSELARRLAARAESPALLTLLVEDAARLLGVEAAGIRLLEGDELVVGARTEAAAALFRGPIKAGEGLSGLVVAGGEPVATSDLSSEPRIEPDRRRGALSQGLQGFLGVPIALAGRTIGSLAVYAKERRHFHADEIALLSTLADHAAAALDASRLVREAGRGPVGRDPAASPASEREIARMKSDFLSFVTHQLWTPLAGVKWMLELARRDRTISAETASYLADASGAAERLIKLVNDLVDVSKLERGTLAPTLADVDMAALTRSALDEAAPALREHGHRVSLTAGGGAPTAVADARLLRRVMAALLSNAIKYSPAGGEIAIDVRQEPGCVQWSIRDSGIGIPAHARLRLFEKFYRADNASQVETEGTGLGLYVVRLIVERLGGRVWCESEEGRGARFCVSLPSAGGPAAAGVSPHEG